VTAAARAAWSRVEPLAGQLPWQAVHGDVTDDNVVCHLERGLRTPDGIIDFGDLTNSWAVGELAVAITSVLRHAGAEPCSALPAVRAFGELRPLSAEEAAVLWPLVVMRAAVLVVSGEQQAAIDGVNDYVTGALEHERRLFERAMSVPAEVMTGLILAELGLDGEPLRVPSGPVPGLGPWIWGPWIWGPWIWDTARCSTCRSSPTRSTRGPGWSRGSRTGWPRPCWPRGTTPWPPGSARHG